MSAESYRVVTRPEVLQCWHGLLREAAIAEEEQRTPDTELGPVMTVYDQIADALDHVTGWAPRADPVTVDLVDTAAPRPWFALCALCPTGDAPSALGETEHVARGALGEHTERAHGRPPWPTIMMTRS